MHNIRLLGTAIYTVYQAAVLRNIFQSIRHLIRERGREGKRNIWKLSDWLREPETAWRRFRRLRSQLE